MRQVSANDDEVHEVRSSGMEDIAARVDRLESLDQIRQLPVKYALALDMRDLDMLVNLFVEDVGVPGKQRGRHALRRWYNDSIRASVIGTAHGVNGHVIELESADLGAGIVYSRNDLESIHGVWMIEMMVYLDRYERREGVWYFQRRTPLFWYECDIANPPVGPNKLRWPKHAWSEGDFHTAFPSWEEFQRNAPDLVDRPVAPPAAPGQFIQRLTRGRPAPKVKGSGGPSSSR